MAQVCEKKKIIVKYFYISISFADFFVAIGNFLSQKLKPNTSAQVSIEKSFGNC